MTISVKGDWWGEERMWPTVASLLEKLPNSAMPTILCLYHVEDYFSVCYVKKGSSALGRIQGNELVWKTVASDLTISSKTAARCFLIWSCHSLPQDHLHRSPRLLQDRGAQMVMNVWMLHLQRAGGPGNSTWGSTALGKVAFLALQSTLTADKETEQPLVSLSPSTSWMSTAQFRFQTARLGQSGLTSL